MDMISGLAEVAVLMGVQPFFSGREDNLLVVVRQSGEMACSLIIDVEKWWQRESLDSVR